MIKYDMRLAASAYKNFIQGNKVTERYSLHNTFQDIISNELKHAFDLDDVQIAPDLTRIEQFQERGNRVRVVQKYWNLALRKNNYEISLPLDLSDLVVVNAGDQCLLAKMLKVEKSTYEHIDDSQCIDRFVDVINQVRDRLPH